MQPTKDSLQLEGLSEDQKKIFHANGKPKRTGVIISGKTRF